MTLEQMILSELQHIELNGIRILRVISKSDVTQIIFEISPAIVEFVVNDEHQYQILQVTYDHVVYQNPEYLSQFDHIVIYVIKKVKPIEMMKRDELARQQAEGKFVNPLLKSRLEALEQREQKISEQEKLLAKKEQEIKEKEEWLASKEQTLAFKQATELAEKNARKASNRKNAKRKIKRSVHSIGESIRKAKRKEASEGDEEILDAYSEHEEDLN